MFILAILGLLVVLGVLAIVFTETDRFGFATLTLLVSIGLMQGFHIVDVLHYVEHHALQSLAYAGAYVALGVGWSFVKWFSYLMSFRDKYREVKERFLNTKGLNPAGQVPEEMMVEYKNWLVSTYGRWPDKEMRQIQLLERPKASNNKSAILAWMTLWPFSFIGTVLNDPIRRLFNFLFNSFKKSYQALADRVLAKDVELK